MLHDWETFGIWEDMTRAFSGGKHFNGEGLSDICWKTLIAGLYETEEQMCTEFKDWYQPLHIFQNLRKEGNKFADVCDDDQEGTAAKILSFFSMSLKTTLLASKFGWYNVDSKDTKFRMMASHRRFIKTEGGYLGLTTRFAEVSDYVGLFKGGRMPLLVRKKGEDWRLMGDAYIHGVMNGEGFQEDMCQDM